MDIDSLYTAGLDAGINFDNEDSVNDLREPWMLACLQNKEWLAENADELMACVRLADLYDAGEAAAKACLDREYLVNNCRLFGSRLADTYANALTGRLDRIGSIFAAALVEMAAADVSRNLHDWFADCVGYHRDCMEGRAEDQAISRAEWLREEKGE